MSAKAASRACSVAVAVLLMTAGSLVAPARAQSLADIAKKEEDRRKTVPAPSKVYTNKDLAPTPAGSLARSSSGAPSTSLVKSIQPQLGRLDASADASTPGSDSILSTSCL